MSITSLILKLAVPQPKLEGFERYMFIGPHPDDIEIGAGATAAKLAAEGKKICFVICTDGRFGGGNTPGLSPDELAELRRQEALKAAKRLGVEDVRFLELSDGGFYTEAELEKRLAFQIGDFKPEVIFAPDFAVKSECHKDHLTVGRISSQLACFAPYGGVMSGYGASEAPTALLALYFTSRADTFVKTSSHFEAQLKAIADHASQFPAGSPELKSLELYLKIRSCDFGLRSLCSHAEGFRVLDALHMHCFPEADT